MRFLSLMLCFLISTFSAPVTLAESGFGVGFHLGPGYISVDDDAFNDGSLSRIDNDGTVITTSVFGEYRTNRFMRLEFGMLDGSSGEMNASSNGFGTYWWGDVTVEYALGGIKVGAAGVIPIGPRDKFKLIGKVGLVNWFSAITFTDVLREETEVDTGIAPYIGVGMELDLNKLMSLRLQHETFSVQHDSDIMMSSIDMDYNYTGLGMVFRF